jgi:ubiquitin-small subunit ribosomal protein S27Ae
MAKDEKAAGAADKKPEEKKDKPKPAAAAKKGGPAKSESTSKKDHYVVAGNKLERKGRNCPKCGPGVFLAEHKDRNTCGKCGYTEFRNKK